MDKKYNYITIINEISSLENKCDEIEKDCLKNGETWESYVEKTREYKTKIFELDKEARLIKKPGIEGDKKWRGKLMTIDEFVKAVNNGEINDDSNNCYYSNGNIKTDVMIYPSDVEYDKVRNDFTHVLVMDNTEI